MAEGMGFEPTVRASRTHTFQACSFDHSDTLPKIVLCHLGQGIMRENREDFR